MKQLSAIIIFVLYWLSGLSQNEPFERILNNKVIIDSGVYRNFAKYDIGDFIVYNGMHENNLKFQIINKKTSKIIYSYYDTLSDAMILKPVFFNNIGSNYLIIMLEVAAEYSWGQELILIINGKVFHPGYLNYARVEENGTSIANHSHFIRNKNLILLTFDDVPLVNWDNEKVVIPGSTIRFEITEKQINKIQITPYNEPSTVKRGDSVSDPSPNL
jgi:hypothetical protein